MSCSAQTKITRYCVLEATDGQNIGRIGRNDGTLVLRADVTSIQRKTFDLDSTTPDTAVDTSAPVVNAVIYDTLQTDDRWTKDSTGYNFLDVVASTILIEGGHRYKVEYYFTMVVGGPIAKFYEITVENARGN